MTLSLALAVALCGCAAPTRVLNVESDVEPIAPPLADAQATEGRPETGDLLQALVENGALTLDQAKRLRAAGEAPAGGPPSASAGPRDSLRLGPGGLQFESDDGEYSMRIGGRLHLDGNVHSRERGTNEDAIQDGTEIRRARFELRGALPEGVNWFGEVDFGDNKTSIKDFRFQKDLTADSILSIGHQKQPYSLAVEESSNDLPFVERSIDNALVIPFVDRAIGVRYQGHAESFFWAAGVFGEGASNNAVDDEGYGESVRLVYAPVQEDAQIVHLGLRGTMRTIGDGSQTIRLRDETTNMSNFSVVDTGTIAGVRDVTIYGPEFAYVNGPFSIGGELNFMEVEVPGVDLDFNSWHVYAAYSLTGESRAKAYRIDEGEFKRLRAEGPSGHAWELALRFAELDLIDGAIDGGREQAINVGLNCYWSNNLRYMCNWTHILETEGGNAATASAEGDDIFTVRAQLLF